MNYHFGKTFTALFLLSTIILSNVFFLDTIKAQSITDGGVSVSPALTRLKLGESYTLRVQNGTDSSLDFSVRPSLFSIDSEARTFRASETPPSDEILSEYLKLAAKDLTVGPNSVSEVSITYLKEYPGAVLGVLIKDLSNDDKELGIGRQIASIIIDSTISDGDLGLISNNIELSGVKKLGPLFINSDFEVLSKIQNGSNKIIKVFGEVELFKGETRHASSSLSSRLPDNFAPDQKFETQSKLSAKLPFYKKVGNYTVRQTLTVNDKEVIVEKQIFVFPIELIICTAVIVLLFILFILFRHKILSSKLSSGTNRTSSKSETIIDILGR